LFARRRVVEDVLSPTNRQVNLPRDALIDSITLMLEVTLSNSDTANAQTAKIEEILKAFSSIRVISDGSNTHVSLPGDMLLLTNYYDYQGKTPKLDDTVSVPAGGTATVKIPLVIDFGDIHAFLKDSLVMVIDFTRSVSSNISIEDFVGKISLREIVFDSPEEYLGIYGPNGERIVEPKVYTIIKSFDVLSEPKPVISLPVGTLLARGIVVTEDSTGALADVVDKLAIASARGALETLYEDYWDVIQVKDKYEYNVDPLSGVGIIDYGAEITGDGVGLNMLDAQVGDVVLKLKTTAAGKLVYISHEYVPVNPEAVLAGEIPVEEVEG